jgi:hypothetical protein
MNAQAQRRAAMRPGGHAASYEQKVWEAELACIAVKALRAEGYSDEQIIDMTVLNPAADRAFERQQARQGKVVAAWRVKALIVKLVTQ